MNPDGTPRLRVGEVARATGLTVRTLHHYEEVGLLRPSGRTAAGHRYYLPKDMERLARIVLLRHLGLSLQEIRRSLTQSRGQMLPLLEEHLRNLDAHLDEQVRRRKRVAELVGRLRRDEELEVGDLLQTIEETMMFEKHFDKDQLDWLAKRKDEVGAQRIAEVEAEWPELIAAVRDEMDKGTDPGDPVVQQLATRWQQLVDEFTAGRDDIAAGVTSVYQNEPSARQRTGLDAAVMAYVGKALNGPKG